MNRPTRTNPAYARLAFRHAIVSHVSQLLSSDYTTVMGGDEPEHVIHSEHVFPEDNPVPETEITDYIKELDLEGEQLRLELLKFNFVKQEDEATPVKRVSTPKASSSKGNGQGNGRSRRKGR